MHYAQPIQAYLKTRIKFYSVISIDKDAVQQQSTREGLWIPLRHPDVYSTKIILEKEMGEKPTGTSSERHRLVNLIVTHLQDNVW
jgi:hypothetical protein